MCETAQREDMAKYSKATQQWKHESLKYQQREAIRKFVRRVCSAANRFRKVVVVLYPTVIGQRSSVCCPDDGAARVHDVDTMPFRLSLARLSEGMSSRYTLQNTMIVRCLYVQSTVK